MLTLPYIGFLGWGASQTIREEKCTAALGGFFRFRRQTARETQLERTERTFFPFSSYGTRASSGQPPASSFQPVSVL